ncbi:MAG: cbb3-type cytochrome c oxidase subunit II [Acidobacteriota bacterium]|nr:cbb3-type cytochrome c oxidase subunit II [Acidobacteriota bacterium]
MRSEHKVRDWRGAILVAAVYVYFLIFAQFAFLELLSADGLQDNKLKAVMAAMAVGGILFSLLTPRLRIIADPARRIRIGLILSALAAALSVVPLSFTGAIAVAFLIGAGLGIVTVTLVTYLVVWCGEQASILKTGVGVGIGYLICNIPAVFTASAKHQALFSAFVFLAVAFLPLADKNLLGPTLQSDAPSKTRPYLAFPLVLIAFTALIWLDSSAFYIIQHSGVLKAGTWSGDLRLWAIGAIHFVFAIASAFLLLKKRIALVLISAFAFLGSACALLAHPALIHSAALFYPAGVSLYSVALVIYPSSISSHYDFGKRARQAGWLYAIAGWIGSALGIGMGQNLGHIPTTFVLTAGVLVSIPLGVGLARTAPREVTLLAFIVVVSMVALHFLPTSNPEYTQTAIERGRQVYIEEGCISCHSQYVRPGTSDVLMWGPASTPAEIHAEKPPLIGNRRQGPDLSEVGLRRSSTWLKEHLIAPRTLTGNSIMPSYAYLFDDGRGNDLVAYLASLQSGDIAAHLAEEHAWRPSASAVRQASLSEGKHLYREDCATCHEARGDARVLWSDQLKPQPPDLSQMRRSSEKQDTQYLAQIIKFGIQDTDMPGHEWLSDRQVASLSLWIHDNSSQPIAKH